MTKVSVILEGMPAYYGSPLVAFYNRGEETATFAISFELIVGIMENPDQAVIGTNTATIEANTDGYYYKWTATEAGTLTVTMPSTGDWFYVVNNITDGTYGDFHYGDVATEQLTVEAGDEIQIQINTYDPNSWSTPAGTVEWTLSFTAA